MRDRLAAKSVEGMEMRLQQMSSSQRERLAAENAEEREVRLQHDSEPQGAASARNTWRPVTSPTYSRCKCSMHIWLHWRCPLLTESFACHSSRGMTLVLGTLIPFVISVVFLICPCMVISISDLKLGSCRCNNQ